VLWTQSFLAVGLPIGLLDAELSHHKRVIASHLV
jgi:hypothetical protein